MKKMQLSEKQEDRLREQLIKLGDMLGDGDAEPWVEKEYRKVCKILFPEQFKEPKRKPSQALIRTLKKCDCGAEGFKWSRKKDLITISCGNCQRSSGECTSNAIARDKWNESFNPAKQISLF